MLTLWKSNCLTYTGDKVLKGVDRCDFWLQKACSSHGPALPSSPPSSLCSLQSLYLSPPQPPGSEPCAVEPRRSKVRTKKTASGLLSHHSADLASPFTYEGTNMQASDFTSCSSSPSWAWLLLDLTLWVAVCKVCPLFAWLRTLPLTSSLHSPSPHLQQALVLNP